MQFTTNTANLSDIVTVSNQSSSNVIFSSTESNSVLVKSHSVHQELSKICSICISLLCLCNIILSVAGGWSGGAMVLGKLLVPGRPTILITVGQGPTALAVGAGGGCLDIFTLLYPFLPLSPSLWETARYRLKYCLKGPLNQKQPTNQPLSVALIIICKKFRNKVRLYFSVYSIELESINGNSRAISTSFDSEIGSADTYLNSETFPPFSIKALVTNHNFQSIFMMMYTKVSGFLKVFLLEVR